jgi:hypothetical protein
MKCRRSRSRKGTRSVRTRLGKKRRSINLRASRSKDNWKRWRKGYKRSKRSRNPRNGRRIGRLVKRNPKSDIYYANS